MLEIIYEDKDFLVINKSPGVSVHKGEGDVKSPTIADLLSNKIQKGVGQEGRNGIVHRLDKDTSGVMIVARTGKAYDYFVEAFKKHDVKKTYLALVKGILEHKEAFIDSPISRSRVDRKKMDVSAEFEGKKALSGYKVVSEFEFSKDIKISLLEIEIMTGRTHQIRVHMKAIKHPVIGDSVYGDSKFNQIFASNFGLERQFLHAWKISFKDIDSGKTVKFKADLPKDLSDVLKGLKA